MFLHPQTKGLEALQDIERILRRHAGANIHHAFRADPHGQGCRAELFPKNRALIPEMRGGQHGELIILPPVEIAPINHCTAQGDAMAAHPFGE